MTTQIQRPSAKIYEFPMRARALTNVYRADAAQVVKLPAKPVTHVAYDGAWYHEAAVQAEYGQPS